MGRNIITTVVAASESYDLAVLADVKDDWSISGSADDNFVSRSITRCSRAAAQFCNRVFALETVQDLVFFRRGEWPGEIIETVAPLQLSRWPIAAIISVTIDGTSLIEGTDFVTDEQVGQLRRFDVDGREKAWTGTKATVVYAAGYVLPGQAAVAGAQPLPADISDAVSRMVYTRYAERQRDPLVKSEYVDGVGRTEYLEPSSDGNLSPDVEDILDNYRVPVIA
jgi:hypothetical protein